MKRNTIRNAKAIYSNYLSMAINALKSNSNLAKNTCWLIGEKIFQLLVWVPLTMLLARYLGPKDFGIYNYVISFVMLFAYFTTMGLGGVVVREIVSSPEAENDIIGTTFFVRLAGGSLGFLFSIVLIQVLRVDDLFVQSMTAIYSLSLFFLSFEVVSLFFEAHVRSKYTALAKLIVLVINAFLILFFWVYGASLNIFIWLKLLEHMLLGVIFFIFYLSFSRSPLDWRFKPHLCKNLLMKSWPLLLSGITAAIYLKIDQIMLGEMVGDVEVGIYSAASRLSEVWYFIPLAIASSFFPSLVKMKKNDEKKYRERIQMLFNSMVIIAVCLAIPLSIMSEPIIILLYGSEYIKAAAILSIHIWAAIFIFMRAILSKWLIIEQLFIYSLVTHGLGAIINVVMNIVLIPEYHGIGAAIATVISYATASYLALFLSKKTYEAAYMMTKALLFPIRLVAIIRD